MTDNSNGTHNGVWHTLVLPDSGYTLEYRPVSHMLLSDAVRSVRRPEPPLIEVDYSGNKRMEPNVNSPEYQLALSNFQAAQNNKALEIAVLIGVQVTVHKERCDELRQALVDSGLELPRNDKVLYVTRILCETGLDLQTLRDAIIRRSQPTEGAVAESTDRFQSDVQGDATL